MSDLVERLRNRKAFGLNGTWIMLNVPDSDCQEAADRIAELERICAELYQVIGSLADHAGCFDHPDGPSFALSQRTMDSSQNA